MSGKFKLSALAMGIGMVSGGGFVYADEASPFQLEEIVVTAQKRTQSLSDVPVSVSAVSGDKISDAGITDLADLSALVPNFQKAELALGSVIAIRGISSGINQGFEQSVVQYVDEVAMGRAPLARAPFMDLSRVEVLRGPQNVLFGKNSIGGALSLSTNLPTEELEGSIRLEYEPEYETQTTQFVLSGPLSDSVRGRIALRYYEDDGYFKNSVSGEDEANREDYTARGVVEWDVNDSVSTLLKYEYNKYDLSGRGEEITETIANPLPASPTNPFGGLDYGQAVDALGFLTGQNVGGGEDGKNNFRRNTTFSEFSDTKSDNYTFTVNWEAEEFSFTSVTSYLSYETDELVDADGTGADLFSLTQKEDYEQFSQEIRFVSPGGETFDWIVGGYYQDWELDYDSDFVTDDENVFTALAQLNPASGLDALESVLSRSEYSGDSETAALFGQVTWNIVDDFRITVGGRYTVEEKRASRKVNFFNAETGQFDFNQAIGASLVFGVDYENLGRAVEEIGGTVPGLPGVSFPIHNLDEDRTERLFTPTIIAEWDVSDSALTYFNWSKGAKAGGFDARGNRASNFEYEDESVTSYEIGVKHVGWDGRIETNLALFYIDYEDLQVSQFDGTLGFVVGNAAEATSQGLELDGRFQMTEELLLSYSMAYLDFEFDDYSTAACGERELLRDPSTSICDRTGSSNTYSPEWTASTTLDYSTPLSSNVEFRATLDVSYVDDQLVDPLLESEGYADSYTKVGLRLALEAESWGLALVGKNLTDETIVNASGSVPLGRELFGSPAFSSYLGRPRTVSVQAAYYF